MSEANVKHPIITFSVNLVNNYNIAQQYTEAFGPKTNSRDVVCVPSDRTYPTTEAEFTAMMTRIFQQNAQKVCWLPGLLGAENISRKDDGTWTFTAYGQKATYLKNTYASGTKPLLYVESETYASE